MNADDQDGCAGGIRNAESDVETGDARRVTITEWTVKRYAKLYGQFCRSVEEYCTSHTVPAMQVACDAPEDEVLMGVLGGKRIRATA